MRNFLRATGLTFALTVLPVNGQLEILEEEEFDNECKPHRSCFKPSEVKYNDIGDWPQCRSDGDCLEGFYCLNHMWSWQEELETGQGCWKRNVCTGNGAYVMFEERKQQYFCSEEQFAENLDTEPPQDWNLVPSPEKFWDEYKPACETDADCPRPDLG